MIPRFDGTENNNTAAIAKGIAILKIQGLALPYLDLVLSTIIPIVKSLNPSSILDTSIILPTAAALTSA